MQILMNAQHEKLELYARSTGTKFLPLKMPENSKDAVAVVVRGESFKKDIELAAGLNIPVVVVAGNRRGDYIREATAWGIPGTCILIKEEDKVCSLDGREICTSAKGIGVKAIIKTAEYALKNGLLPEPLVWIEEEEEEEPVILEETPEEPEKPAKENKQNVVRLARDATGRLESILEMAEKITVVFRSTQDAESGPVARDIAARIDGVHLELSAKPASYGIYGQTLEEAVRSGKYIFANANTFNGNSYAAKHLVAEIDIEIMPSLPELVDRIYKRADKVIHTVGKDGEKALSTWVDSGWKLEAVIPNQPVFDAIKRAFGKIVYPNALALTAQFQF